MANDGRSRAGDYRMARIGAAAALVVLLVCLALGDAFSETYELQTQTLVALLGAIGGLLGVEFFTAWRRDVK